MTPQRCATLWTSSPVSIRTGPMRVLLTTIAVALALTACGTDGPHYGGESPDPVATFGQCALCHGEIATRMTETGGHHDLGVKCQLCHAEALAEPPGPGHRSIPACADCHAEPQTHHDPAADMAGECLQCHGPHGSFNLLLLNENILTPSNGLRPVEFDNRQGRADGSYASPSNPGTGVCEICHSTTKFYRNDGSGAEHFTTTCVQCHAHQAGFAVSVPLDQCEICHGGIVTRMEETGGHGVVDANCEACHQNLRPGEVGAGHRSVPVCADCHAQPQTHHDPAADMAGECLQCHGPHGSFNLLLLNENILTPSNGLRPVEFDNRQGRADGSYASPSNPGTGVCEICHSTTKFYRADASGADHFTTTCVECHGHEKGFALSVDTTDCAICHDGIVTRMDETGGHGSVDSLCEACHRDQRPGGAGEGHRAVPRCNDCHRDPKTHFDPATGTADECTQCHTPHGSLNLLLVKQTIRTLTGAVRPITFTNRDGRADGSFASPSSPGTGVCEICHRGTEFYRSDGGGEEHFTTTCTNCHLHASGFEPPEDGD